jgi:ATP-dependent DNA ligase
VAVDPQRARPDFTALSQRFTAGRTLSRLTERRPAQLVIFDLLAAGGEDLRPWPLQARRSALEAALANTGGRLALCPQTQDPAAAMDWIIAGVEGLVLKDARAAYPTAPRRSRIWLKWTSRHSIDLVATAVIGDPAKPLALVLSSPGPDGRLRTAGVSTVLPAHVSRHIGRLLAPTGQTAAHYPALRGIGDALDVALIHPLVVEVSADTAIDNGVLRHPARLIRARPDLTVADLTY